MIAVLARMAVLSLVLGCSAVPGRGAIPECADVGALYRGSTSPAPPAPDARADDARLVVRFRHSAGKAEVRDAIERVRGCVLGVEAGFWYVETRADDAEPLLMRTPAVAYVERAAAHRRLRAITPWVPARPPSGWLLPSDSVAAMLDRDNLVFEHPRMSGPYPRDLLMLQFAPASSLAERRAAVDRIGGSVVGGDMAHYYVRLRLDCPDLPVWCGVDRLAGFPQVLAAAPLDMGYGPLRDE